MKKRTWIIAATATAGIAAAAVPAVNAFAEEPPGNVEDWCATDDPEPQPLYELVSDDGTGRVYTLLKDEAESAVSKHNMKLEEDPVAYLPCQDFAGSISWERLKPSHNADTWLVARADDDEADQLVDKGWVKEGMMGFAYQDSKGKVLLNRYSNGEEWRIAPESETAALKDAGYHVDGPLGYAYAEAP